MKALWGKAVTHPLFHCLLVICVSVGILNSGYPRIGHDYLSLVRGLDTLLFYLNSGLQIQWWSPWFGGGLPSYSDPIQMQFTLPQFLMFILQPWTAVIVSAAFFIGLGYAGAYLLIRRCCAGTKADAVLGATLFCTSAYMIEHLCAGHLNYITFGFLPMIVWLLLDRGVSRPVAVCLIASMAAYIVHCAGFYFVVIFGLAVPLTIAIAIVSNRIRLKAGDCSLVAVASLALGFCMSISKLLAVHDFLRYFPRTLSAQYIISPAKALVGLVFELFFAPPAIFIHSIPVDHILRRMTGADYGLWEIDAGLSPVILFIIGASLLLVKDNPFQRFARYLFSSRRRILAFTVAIALGLLSVEFTLARGFPFSIIKTLPFFASLHANTRNAAIFILPIIIVSVFIRQWLQREGIGKRILNPWLLSLCSIMVFACYMSVPPRFGHLRVDAKSLDSCWKSIRTAPHRLVCRRISDIGDDRVFLEPASSRFPSMPIFGYQLEDFKPEIHSGAVTDTNSGCFNMTNPASLIYPRENNLRQFKRISVSDKENFLNFISNRPTTWKRPHYQYVVDRVSQVALFATVAVLLAYAGLFAAKKMKQGVWR